MEPPGQQSGIFRALFGQKRPLLCRGPPTNHFFLQIFDREEQPQVWVEFSHFGYFWSFLAKKCRFWSLAKKPETNTTSLVPKNLNLQNLKSDFQYLTKWSQKRYFLCTFRPKMTVFETGSIYKPLFITDFWWGGTDIGLGGVFSFWIFLVIFGQKCQFLRNQWM